MLIEANLSVCVGELVKAVEITTNEASTTKNLVKRKMAQPKTL